jgi:hypothetical protein
MQPMSKVTKLFFGHGVNLKKPRPALKNQVYTFLRIWRNYDHHDFGIERLIRLFLAGIQFFTPGLYIKHAAGALGTTGSKIAVEFYVVVKMVFPLLGMSFGLGESKIAFALIAIFLFETIIYVTSLIFISDASKVSVQPRRSLSLLFVNFFEIIFDFAFMYMFFSASELGFFQRPIQGTTDAIYFSFVTAATVGFGDIVPAAAFAKKLVILQITLTFVFVGLFLNFFSSLLHKAQNIETEQSYRKTRHKSRTDSKS